MATSEFDAAQELARVTQWRDDIMVVANRKGENAATTAELGALMQREELRRDRMFDLCLGYPVEEVQVLDNQVAAHLHKNGFCVSVMEDIDDTMKDFARLQRLDVLRQKKREEAKREEAFWNSPVGHVTSVARIALLWTVVFLVFNIVRPGVCTVSGGASFIFGMTLVSKVLWEMTPDRM